MPIYEFRCLDCGVEFETLLLGSSSPVSCKKCNSTKIKRLISAVSFKSGNKGDNSISSAPSSLGCSTCSSKSCNTCK